MPTIKQNRPSWFRIYLTGANLIQALSSEEVGDAFKATLRYFLDRTYVPEDLSPLAEAVFRDLCRGVDEAYQRYEASVEAGKLGAERRWGKAETEEESYLKRIQSQALSRSRGV